MEKVYNNYQIKLVFDENINVWNTNKENHNKYDALWLPDLGAAREPLNKLIGKELEDFYKSNSFPLPSGKNIYWQEFFTEHHTREDRTNVFIELVKMIKLDGYIYFSKFMTDNDTALRLTKASLMEGYTAELISINMQYIYIPYIRIF
jgi:hypothetical protein